MEQVKWLLSNLKPYLGLVSLVIFGSILEGLGTSFMTYLVKRIMDDVFILKEANKLYMILYLFAGAAIVIQIGFFLRNFLMNMVSEKLLMDFRERMFSSLLYSKVDFFINHPAGDIVSRFNNDINAVKNILIDYMLSLIKEPITVLLLLGVLIYRDIYLTIIIIVAFPVISYSVKYFGSKKAKYVKLNQERLGMINQHVTQLISGVESIKIFGAEGHFLEKFKDANKNLFKAGIKSIFYTVMNSIFNQSTGYIVFGLVLLYGGYRIVHGYTSPGNFISYITALLLIQMPIMETQKGFMNMRSSIPLVKRVQEMLSLHKEEDGHIDISSLKVPISMKHVYVIIDSKEILKDITLQINPGEKIGIVGPTGAGKSTLLDILPKLVSYKGDVYIKDTPLESISNKSIRSKIAFASQHVFIFNDSVRNNLLLANPKASDELLIKALKLAKAEFLLKLKNGLDTILGEQGYSVSGGERQRIAIARLFLTNPDVILLDEITSALDVHTEQAIISNIFDVFKDKTILIVAHRLSNITNCNKILYVEDGRILEEGTFEELLKKQGNFYALYNKSR